MTTLTVEDVMTRDVVTAPPETCIKELARLMHRTGMSCIPIVDEFRHLYGLVTEADLLRVREEPRPRGPLRMLIHPRKPEDMRRGAGMLSARGLMTRTAVLARPETSAREAARLLLRSRFRCLPVVDRGGHLVGIATRRDLLAPLIRNDEEIRREINEEIGRRAESFDPALISVGVKDGVVTLQGEVVRRDDEEALISAVRHVAGVVGVCSLLTSGREDHRKRRRTGGSSAAETIGR